MTDSFAIAKTRALWAAESERRRRYWIAGVPTPRELAAVDRIVGHRLNTTPEAVRAAVEEVRPATLPREKGPLT